MDEAEAATLLGLITGTLAKIAADVMLMSSAEFGEVSEPFVPGRGASSTMPQKRNPVSSELMLAAAKSVRQHVATMLDGMNHDFERATGPWHAEWIALPESFLLTGASLAHAKFMLAGLVVHEDRMRRNLDLTGGLIVAEAVMMAAAPELGRQHAHDVVYAACREAIENGGTLAERLAAVPEIVAALGWRGHRGALRPVLPPKGCAAPVTRPPKETADASTCRQPAGETIVADLIFM